MDRDHNVTREDKSKASVLAEQIAGLLVNAQVLIAEFVQEQETGTLAPSEIVPTAAICTEEDGCITIKTNAWLPKYAIYPRRGVISPESFATSSYPAVRKLWRNMLINAMKGIPHKPLDRAAVLIVHRRPKKKGRAAFDPANIDYKVILDALVALRFIDDDSHEGLVLLLAGEYTPNLGTDIYITDCKNIHVLRNKMPSHFME